MKWCEHKTTSAEVKVEADGYEDDLPGISLSQEAIVAGEERAEDCEEQYSALLDPAQIEIEEASRKRQREDDISWLERYGLTQGVMAALPEAVMKPEDEDGDPSGERKKARISEEEQRKTFINQEANPSIQMLLRLGFEGKDKMEEMEQSQSALSKKVDDHKKEQDAKIEANKKEQDDKIAELQRLILQHQTVGVPPGLDASSDTVSLTSASTAAMARKTWRPQYIEIKGWVSNWKCPKTRSAQMILYADLQQILNNMVGICKPEDRRLVDTERTIRLNSGRTLYGSAKLGFATGTDSETIWRIKKFFDQVILPTAQRTRTPDPWWPIPIPQGDVLIANVQQQGMQHERFKFLVDAPPWKRPHIKAVSKFQGVAKAVFFPAEIPFKGEMGPPKSTILVNHPPKPYLLAEWSGNGWEIFEEQWETMKTTFQLENVSIAQFKTELAKS